MISITTSRSGVVVAGGAGSVSGGRLVNCAGLESDRVARLAGVKPHVRILPFRGTYLGLRAERRDLVRNLLYPVPDPSLPFLGVHFTRTIDNRVLLGPNAVPAASRYGYRARDVSVRDVLDEVLFPGTWRLIFRYWRVGVGELRRALRQGALLAAARRLLPALEAGDLEPAGSGVRAQAVDRAGRLVDDFRFLRRGPTLHVLNAPSPAATAALAIGREIAERAFDDGPADQIERR